MVPPFFTVCSHKLPFKYTHPVKIIQSICEYSDKITAAAPLQSTFAKSQVRCRAPDLRESGAIEQDADSVMFIYRDDYYNENSEEKNIAECIVAKNRHGETGTVKLQWLPQFTTFSNLEWKHEG